MLRMAGIGGTKRAASPTRAISPPPLKRTTATVTSKTTVTSETKNRLPHCADKELIKITASTENAAANFFTPLSQKKPDPITWRIVNNTLIVGKYSSETAQQQTPSTAERRRIAAFDLVSYLQSSRMRIRADRCRILR